MDLVRLAVAGITGLPKTWDDLEITYGDVTLRTLARVGREDVEQGVLFGAHVHLDSPLKLDEEGLVLVPDVPRRAAEHMIETTADQISILANRSRNLRSINPAVVFFADDETELAWLKERPGISGADQLHATHGYTVDLEPEMLRHLVDRQDGATLLADAITHRRHSDQFRALIRVFERAFACSSSELVLYLSQYMEARPGLGYSKTEIKRWITRLRGPAVHADRHDLPVEADFRHVVPRMKFAAYDVLLNKAAWRDQSTNRREMWSPTTAPRTDGGLMAMHATGGAGEVQITDAFGAYVQSLQQIPGELDGNYYWPTKGPSVSRAPAGTFEVALPEKFAVRSGD